MREYTFLHSKTSYNGVPIMAANMDTIGTFVLAVEMCKVCACMQLQNMI